MNHLAHRVYKLRPVHDKSRKTKVELLHYKLESTDEIYLTGLGFKPTTGLVLLHLDQYASEHYTNISCKLLH